MSELIKPLPCPFCGATEIRVEEGSTFRWRLAVCSECDARCGEVRHATTSDDQTTAEHNSITAAYEEWNKRSPAGSVSVPRELLQRLRDLAQGLSFDTAREVSALLADKTGAAS